MKSVRHLIAYAIQRLGTSSTLPAIAICYPTIKHTDFPTKSPQIQFIIEKSLKLLTHKLAVLNAKTDIELYHVSVIRSNYS